MNDVTIPLEKFLEIATPEQKELLNKLYELAGTEKQIASEINNIYDSREDGVYVGDKGAITLYETEEDAMIVSMSSREKLAKVRSEISRLLISAVNELDMGNVGIIQRQYKNYVGDKK